MQSYPADFVIVQVGKHTNFLSLDNNKEILEFVVVKNCFFIKEQLTKLFKAFRSARDASLEVLGDSSQLENLKLRRSLRAPEPVVSTRHCPRQCLACNLSKFQITVLEPRF